MLRLVALVLLSGCATGTFQAGRVGSTPLGRHAPDRYAQSVDSATSACLRNPACFSQTGDEALIPWLSRSLQATRTAATVMRLLEAAELARVERILIECAKEAHYTINDREFGGRSPTREQCQEALRREGDRVVTRAMELGDKKHALALDCARRELGKLFPQNVSVEPRYQKDPSTGKWRWLSPEQVARWLREGLVKKLLGSLVPDIVIHASGDPLKVQRVYDFKFPCPVDKPPSWGRYGQGHPHHPKNQKQMYEELGGQDEPSLLTPFGAYP